MGRASGEVLMIIFYLLIAVLPLSTSPFWGRDLGGGLTVFKLLGGLCVLVAVAYAIRKGSVPNYFHTWPARCYLFLASAQLILYFARGGGLTLEGYGLLANTISVLLLFFVMLTLVDSFHRLRWIVMLTVASAGLSSLAVIHQWLSYRHLYVDFRTYGGLSGDSNTYALLAVLWLPVAYLLGIHRRPAWERLFWLGCCGLMGVGITLTASRGALFGFAISFLVLILHSRRRVAILILALALALIASETPVSPVKRLLHPGYGDEVSSQNHFELWGVSWRIFEHHPLIGVGLAEDVQILRREVGYHVGHNSYLDEAACNGLVGLLPLVGALALSYLAFERVRRRWRNQNDATLARMALGMEAGLAGAATSAFFLSASGMPCVWTVVFLSSCMVQVEWQLRRTIKLRKARQAEDVPPSQEPAWAVEYSARGGEWE